jgi:hypothetical protein
MNKMNFLTTKIYQKAAALIFILFMVIMARVIITAYTEPSGSTGLTMGKIQQMRYQSSLNQTEVSKE